MVVAAVPVVAAERYVDRSVEDGQCAALVLFASIEHLAGGSQYLGASRAVARSSKSYPLSAPIKIGRPPSEDERDAS
jgi:hypothetical protein